jgi:hypothetical protein
VDIHSGSLLPASHRVDDVEDQATDPSDSRDPDGKALVSGQGVQLCIATVDVSRVYVIRVAGCDELFGLNEQRGLGRPCLLNGTYPAVHLCKLVLDNPEVEGDFAELAIDSFSKLRYRSEEGSVACQDGGLDYDEVRGSGRAIANSVFERQDGGLTWCQEPPYDLCRARSFTIARRMLLVSSSVKYGITARRKALSISVFMRAWSR